jgi:hypothetical protein
MNKIIVFLLLFFVSFNAFYSAEKKDETHSLQEFIIINHNIFPVLDTIITMKDDIKFYKDTKLFSIEFNDDCVRKDLIFVRASGNQIHHYYPDILGYFDYNKHSFVIRGDSIDTTILKKGNKDKNFIFGLPAMRYTAKREPILGDLDVFAVWSIRYKDRNFKILSFFTNNKADSWFDYVEEEYGDE